MLLTYPQIYRAFPRTASRFLKMSLKKIYGDLGNKKLNKLNLIRVNKNYYLRVKIPLHTYKDYNLQKRQIRIPIKLAYAL